MPTWIYAGAGSPKTGVAKVQCIPRDESHSHEKHVDVNTKARAGGVWIEVWGFTGTFLPPWLFPMASITASCWALFCSTSFFFKVRSLSGSPRSLCTRKHQPGVASVGSMVSVTPTSTFFGHARTVQTKTPATLAHKHACNAALAGETRSATRLTLAPIPLQ